MHSMPIFLVFIMCKCNEENLQLFFCVLLLELSFFKALQRETARKVAEPRSFVDWKFLERVLSWLRLRKNKSSKGSEKI